MCLTTYLLFVSIVACELQTLYANIVDEGHPQTWNESD